MSKKFLFSSLISLLGLTAPAIFNIQFILTFKFAISIIIFAFAIYLQPKFKVAPDRTNLWDHGTEAQIIWSAYIIQFLAIVEAAYFRYPDSTRWNFLHSIIFFLMAAGLAIRTWAIFSLGRFFTMHLTVQREQFIVRSGPYKYVRHPSYSGAFLIYVFFPLFIGAWATFCLALFLLPAAWIRRIYHEEKMLKEELGEPYENYCRQVKKIIPWIW
ncbi:MAG: isoprenylcysteine carboxylmethyltransferase family protein [Oligoflexales bacterium]|nr:isoprenylcysteine carboxylmethyltransferase family protein [Oligoflexales bacterium]